MEICDLRTNHLDAPLGVDAERIVFSWTLEGGEQAACEVELHETDPAGNDRGVAWGSGRVASAVPMVACGASELLPRTRYRWRLRAWGSDGGVAEADAWFETSITDSEWEGAWVAMPGFATPMFRSTFDVDCLRDVVAARWYVACGGLVTASMNGKPATDEVLYPDFTDYSVAVTTMTFDVIDRLQDGENVLGLVLGGGWYEHHGYGLRCFHSQLELTGTDGERTVHSTLPSDWCVRSGPWTAEDIVHGEWFDARLDVEGWDMPGYLADSSWHRLGKSFGAPPNAAEPPGGACIGRRGPGQRVISVHEPVERRQLDEQTLVLDFGENRSGRLRVSGNAPTGTQLVMRMGEGVTDGGRVCQLTNKGARGTNAYTFAGRQNESWAAQFSYQGFRWVEVSGDVTDWSALTFQREVMASNCPRTVTFECDHRGLNGLFEMCMRTVESNMFGLLTDCPQRDERQGWLADAWAVTPTVLACFDSLAFYRKWMEDMFAVQDSATGLRWSPTAPPSPKYVQRLGHEASRHRIGDWVRDNPQSDSVYTAGCTIVPWQYYMATGEPGHLEHVYPVVEAHLSAMAARSDFPVVKASWHGDHAAMGWTMDPPAEKTPKHLVAAAVFLQELRIGAAMARCLGQESDAERFDELGRRSCAGLVDGFYDTEAGSFGSQGADGMALELGFCPSDERDRVLAALVGDLKRRGHVTAGLVCSPYVFRALSRNGHSQLVFDTITAPGEPGFMWWQEQGWTTLGEHIVSNRPDYSGNQPGWALVCEWVLEYVAGIRVLAPGYASVEVEPWLPDGLDRLAVTLDTCRGTIAVVAERRNGALHVGRDVSPCITALGRASSRLQ